ncbi:uncharacterized protein VP01_349g3 [Puccinia sorghi]|uniref:Uncharacterized protein n=1 Tax=Puccinia sorghi TaxID=27349 RepID=A0A0L6UVR9_9BASI|nr:uncharacterized protein VP01_349g3 [Puccinia sorghi]
MGRLNPTKSLKTITAMLKQLVNGDFFQHICLVTLIHSILFLLLILKMNIEGSIKNYTNRCIYGIAALEGKYAMCPSESEQSAYSPTMLYHFFDGAIGLFYGKSFSFAFSQNWSRKSVGLFIPFMGGMEVVMH